MHPLQDIEIADEDIDEVERLLGEVIFDRNRRDIIKDLDDLDVQAFPGTGKTTLLVAKLAILAKKWPYQHKGICILSHTNVAREEIEKRLGNTSVGRKLLKYPHFIGTVHSFCNTYIGLPWLRSQSYPIALINDEIALSRRWGNLNPNTRHYLVDKRHKDQNACKAINIPIQLDLGIKEETDTYQAVKQCVKKSFEDGYFTYDEILYFTRYALSQNPIILKAVQDRFPLLMIDEAQDTNALQWEIINKIFCDDVLSKKQYFGDYNQAIFQSHADAEESNKLNLANKKVLTDSHRFSPTIAQFVDRLAYKEDGIQGTYKETGKLHSIFLFDKNKINQVLESYAKYLLSSFTDYELNGNDSLKCYAVGMIHNSNGTTPVENDFPRSVTNYWKDYKPEYRASRVCKNLIDFFNDGKSKAKNGDYWEYVEALSVALIRIFNGKCNKEERISLYGSSFQKLLSRLPANKHSGFRKTMLELTTMSFATEEDWNLIVDKVSSILNEYYNVNVEADSAFFKWADSTIINRNENNNVSENVYEYSDNETGRSVKIYIGSIHSVKGQTHLSTMVMETFWRGHNIENILPWLCQQKGKSNKSNDHRLKCHYVALSRARELICMAVPKNEISNEQRKLLLEQGWNLVDL